MAKKEQGAKSPQNSPSIPPPIPRPGKGRGKASIATGKRRGGKSSVARVVPHIPVETPVGPAGKASDAPAKPVPTEHIGEAAPAVDPIDLSIGDLSGIATVGQAPAPPEHNDAELIEALTRALHVPHTERLLARGEIARGGMGQVDVAFDQVLQRPLAVKTLLESAREQPILVRAFIREAQITGQLDHPNIVPVHDLAFSPEGRLYFSMKLVEGDTLSTLLDSYAQEHQHIDFVYDQLLTLLEIVVKVCDALSFAHTHGVIHCDIKAQNIMVGDFGQVYLMDWGFAQLLRPRPAGPDEDPVPQHDVRRVEDPLPRLPESATSGFVFGTPGYMSPEQARGETDLLDERSDIFSMGALLYQILAGDVPYRAKSAGETVLLAQKGNFPPLKEQSVGGYSLRPRELVRIVYRAMSQKPEDRYPSIEAMKADLVQFLRGGSNFPARRFAAGDPILSEGETGDEAYIITSGECEVYKTIAGKRVQLQVLSAGAVFGEMSLLSSSQRSASVVALTPVTVVVVSREVVDREMNSMKPWMGMFIRTLASRFRELQENRLHGIVVTQPGAAREDHVLPIDEMGDRGQAAPDPPKGPREGSQPRAQKWWKIW